MAQSNIIKVARLFLTYSAWRLALCRVLWWSPWEQHSCHCEDMGLP